MEEHTTQDPEATALTQDHSATIISATADKEILRPPLHPETIAATVDHPPTKPSSTKALTRTNGQP